MFNKPLTIDELLIAKEGKQFQCKEAKRRIDPDEAAVSPRISFGGWKSVSLSST